MLLLHRYGSVCIVETTYAAYPRSSSPSRSTYRSAASVHLDGQMSFDPGPDLWEDEDPVEPPCLEVEITEPQRVAVLFDSHGEVLLELMDRECVTFGFVRPEDNE